MKPAFWRYAGLALAATLPAAGALAQIDNLLGKGERGGDLKSIAGMAVLP